MSLYKAHELLNTAYIPRLKLYLSISIMVFAVSTTSALATVLYPEIIIGSANAPTLCQTSAGSWKELMDAMWHLTRRQKCILMMRQQLRLY